MSTVNGQSKSGSTSWSVVLTLLIVGLLMLGAWWAAFNSLAVADTTSDGGASPGKQVNCLIHSNDPVHC